jgi:hypothetical protein
VSSGFFDCSASSRSMASVKAFCSRVLRDFEVALGANAERIA